VSWSILLDKAIQIEYNPSVGIKREHTTAASLVRLAVLDAALSRRRSRVRIPYEVLFFRRSLALLLFEMPGFFSIFEVMLCRD
jgi:hypothetical protein